MNVIAYPNPALCLTICPVSDRECARIVLIYSYYFTLRCEDISSIQMPLHNSPACRGSFTSAASSHLQYKHNNNQ